MSNVYLSRSTSLYLIKIRNPIFVPDHSIHNNVTLGNGVGSCLYKENKFWRSPKIFCDICTVLSHLSRSHNICAALRAAIELRATIYVPKRQLKRLMKSQEIRALTWLRATASKSAIVQSCMQHCGRQKYCMKNLKTSFKIKKIWFEINKDSGWQ